MNKSKITEDEVKKIAALANIPVAESQAESLTKQFNETLAVVEDLNQLDTVDISGTYSVTGSENVFRADVIEKERVLPREDALKNAKETDNGFFVVEAILDEK